MMTVAMSQQTVSNQDEPGVIGPPTPDTILIQDNAIAQQAESSEAPEDLDKFLLTEHGSRWYANWRSGQVEARWGKPVLQLFAIRYHRG